MEKGPPAPSPAGGAGPPPPVRRPPGRAPLGTPAIVSIVFVVLAGTSGTVLLARDAGGPDASAPAAVATPRPPAPSRTARPATAAPAPATAPATAAPTDVAEVGGRAPTTRAAAAITVPPFPEGTVAPLPTYAGPSPKALLSGSQPTPPPSSSRVTPDELSWPFTQTGQTSKSQAVVVVNTGGEPLHVFPVGISGDNAGDFSIVADTCSGETVSSQQQCTVTVVYAPRTAGDATAALIVSDDSGGTADGRPTKTSSVPLSGSAG